MRAETLTQSRHAAAEGYVSRSHVWTGEGQRCESLSEEGAAQARQPTAAVACFIAALALVSGEFLLKLGELALALFK